MERQKRAVLWIIFLLAAGAILAIYGFARPAPFVVAVIVCILAALGCAGLVFLLAGRLRFADAQRDEDHAIAARMFETCQDGILICDEAGRIILANPSWLRLTGAGRPSDMRNVGRLLGAHREAAPAAMMLADAARTGGSAAVTVHLPAGLGGEDAGPHSYHIGVRPLIIAGDATGKTRQLQVWRLAGIVGQDGAHAPAFGHLENFEHLQKMVTFLDTVPAGFFASRADGRIDYINATLAEWLKMDLAHFVPGALSIADVIDDQNADALLRGMTGNQTTHTTFPDCRLKSADRAGTPLPVRLLHRTHPASDARSACSQTLVVNFAAAEQGSAGPGWSGAAHEMLFETIPLPAAELSANGTIIRVNGAFGDFFGRDFFGNGKTKRITDLPASGGDRLLKALTRDATAGAGPPAPLELPVGTPDLERMALFHLHAMPARPADPSRRIHSRAGDAPQMRDMPSGAHWICFVQETTQKKALEAQFAQGQKLQAIGQLAGGVAHDFNNVLTAIIGFSDLLLANHRPSDPAFQDIMNIKQNANRAAGLVRQLLAFSRRQTLHPRTLAIDDVLADLSILLDRLLGEKVELQLVHGRDVWPILADLNQFEQVIVNLAVNARDAMAEGGRLTIETANHIQASAAPLDEDVNSSGDGEILPAGEYVTIKVSDTGHGMDDATRQKIFEPFFSTKEVGKGTGLGLATVYGIIKQTGAHIFCRSVVGKGTCFTLYFPHQQDAVPEARADTSPGDTPSDLTGSATILLVEDEDAVRAFAARALASRGYEVHQAANGAEALDIMRREDGRIDLVVSDVVMPGMDGPTLLRELRQIRSDLKIIFVSGYAEDAFARNLPENETYSFLAKPFTLRKLATSVKESLAT